MILAFMILAFLKYLGSKLVMVGILFLFILIISAPITMIPSFADSRRLRVQSCYLVICYCGSHTPQCPRTLRACFETVALIPRHQLPQSWC